MQISHTPADVLGANYDWVDTIGNTDAAQSNRSQGRARFETGHVSKSREGGEFVYVRFASAVTECQVVMLSWNGTDGVLEATAVTTTNADGLLGNRAGVVAAAAGASSGQYGWVQVYGRQHALVGQNCQNNTQLNTTATAGVADDDGTANSTLINGLVLSVDAPNTTGPHKAAAILNYPALGIEDPS